MKATPHAFGAALAGAIVVAASALSGPAAGGQAGGSTPPLAPLLTNLGTLHYKVTASERAQLFFDQGLRLTYGFNHGEAVRSFREAARLDSSCGMCYWGQALALGPNINDPMADPERIAAAHTASRKAVALKAGLTATEQAMIDALATRYPTAKIEDWKAPNSAYMQAMEAVAKRFPDDPEVGMMYAASVVETRPWDYWTRKDEPHPGIAAALAAVEKVMRNHPDHPGAHHYYIHMVEATSRPERAIPSADKLEGLMPGAGHVVHMPAHIYMRVGRYADASDSNVRAIAADEDYIAQCQAQGVYPVGYYPHNIHFLWTASTMEGRSQVAIDAARKVSAKTSHDMSHQYTPAQDFLATQYFALVRFGRWAEMLTEAQPDQNLPFVNAMWRYARAVSFARRGQIDRARGEITALNGLAGDISLGLEIGGTSGTTLKSLVELAGHVATGEVAVAEKRWDDAVRAFQTAIDMQDAQRYFEPAPWHYPVRQSLGAALVAAGRAKEAEAVYLEDLRRNPENGWSLFGLTKALEMQNRPVEAATAGARFRRAWARADVALTASVF
jgi:tetratricopeptide (TPR) repeat protein